MSNAVLWQHVFQVVVCVLGTMLRLIQVINCQTHQDRKKQWRNKEGCSSIEGNRARDSTQFPLLYIENPNPYIFTALFFYAFPCHPHPLFIGFPPLRWKVASLFIRAPMNAKVVQTFCRPFFFVWHCYCFFSTTSLSFTHATSSDPASLLPSLIWNKSRGKENTVRENFKTDPRRR